MPRFRPMLTLVVCSAAAVAPFGHAGAADQPPVARTKAGAPDADAVFGLMYAQAEDDFKRVELNFINAMGRLAEVEGEGEVWRDLRMKLFITPEQLQKQYAASPPWLQKLMVAWADGLNYYLHTHPQTVPKLITHFEPWMALSFSEGSIGGDIESVDLKQLEQLYSKSAPLLMAAELPTGLDPEPQGSNGFAIAPSITRDGHALLMINPHTSFYFRPEVQVSSAEGLNAYGAVTWGQFFVYQGFNDRIGWMHTSGGGDVIDEYAETVIDHGGKFSTKYGAGEKPMKAVRIKLPYKLATGGMGEKIVTVYYSHHGPIVREDDGKWIAVKLMNEPLQALTQSYLRTKARNYAAFYKTMELRTNSSNNTVYADADGNIAYFHGNFIPIRDTRFNWKLPVDGSDPATEWKGLHEVKDTITLFNPKNGWIENTNNWPFTAAGQYSPRQQDYPAYMSMNPENARGIHAVRVLENKKDFTLESLIAAAYDTRLTAFEPLIPQLLKAYDQLPADDPQKAALAEPIAALRGWDLRYSLTSVPTTLAVYWGQDLANSYGRTARARAVPVIDYIGSDAVPPAERLRSLGNAIAKLRNDFGRWQQPWGEVNRFQRVADDDAQAFDDNKPSLPVPFASGTWGSLAAFGMTSKPGTRKIYGERGNSFVAAVEFGPRIRAKSILAGGESGDPASKHFTDQAEMYSKGEFKDVLFYKEDVEKHLERAYHPGE